MKRNPLPILSGVSGYLKEALLLKSFKVSAKKPLGE